MIHPIYPESSPLAPRELQIVLLGWVQSKSGLWSPTPAAFRLPVIEVPSELRAPQEFAIVLRRPPSIDEQVFVWISEPELGLETSTLDDTIARIQRVGFELGMRVVGCLGAMLGTTKPALTNQLRAIGALFDHPDDRQRLASTVLRTKRLLLCEQHLMRLARLLVLHAPDRAIANTTDQEFRLLQRAILGMSGIRELADNGESLTRDQAVSWILQSGAYNSSEPLVEALQRVAAVYLELAGRPDLRDELVDIDGWARADQRLNIHQQWAAATAAIGRGDILDDEAAGPQSGLLPATFLDDIAHRLRVDPDHLRNALVADRAWLRQQFAAGEDNYHHALWNRVPFEQRPLLELADGQLLVVSPRCLVSWLTDGFHHRAFNSARARGPKTSGRFGHVIGKLVESYALELMQSVHPGRRPAGAGVVHGDYPYKHPKGQRRTPDIAIDRGDDLVLMEICSGRLTLPTRIDGDLHRDLDSKVIGKATQLSERIDDLMAGSAEIPGVTISDVRRIWPILVAPTGLLLHPILWDYIREQLAGALLQDPVQHLTIIDIAELELVAGLIHQGHDILTLLQRKTGRAYAELDMRRMVWDDPHFDASARSPLVLARSEATWRDAATTLGLDPDQIDFSLAA